LKFGSYDPGAGLSQLTHIQTFHKSTWIMKADNIYLKMNKLPLGTTNGVINVVFEP